jgi:hypothetical protein
MPLSGQMTIAYYLCYLQSNQVPHIGQQCLVVRENGHKSCLDY